MPNKIKIALTLVAIVAVFLVYELAQYVHIIANGNSTFQQGSPLPNPDDDPDHDGLSNQQEVIWGADPFNPDSDGDGFKDGEEVKSGHNPLIPGPDDLISQDNLTQQFSDLAVSGIYSGDLNPDSPSYPKTLADITSAIADSGFSVFSKKIESTDLTIIDGKEDAELLYIENISPILNQTSQLLASQNDKIIDYLNIIGNKGFTSSEVQDYFSNQANAYSDLLNSGVKIRTPKQFKDQQILLMTFLQQMKDANSAIAKGDKDPIRAAFALEILGGSYDGYVDILNNYLDVKN